ncbi:MAG: GDP-mannose 4,6-dehydratase [Cyclobacteriaceae bacterium]|nr:GDP-mannose 4,6-dehydratase [Cyclobacteriaceae bacterium]
MKVLITGAAGFIGLNLAKALIPLHHEVIGLDNFHPQVHGEEPQREFDFPIHEGDIRDLDTLMEVFDQHKFDTIYHLAAETGTGQSFDEPSRYVDVNVRGTTNLFEALRASNHTPTKIILSSSRAIYGEGLYVNAHGEPKEAKSRSSESMKKGDFEVYGECGTLLQAKATPEHFFPKPDSVYASTKLMQELLLNNLCSDTDWNILRFQNVYGPGQSLKNPYTGVLSIFCSQIKSGITLQIYEDGQIFRDFIYIDDVVNSLVAAINAPSREIINIGSGESIPIIDVVKLLSTLAHEKGFQSEFKITGKFREGDIRFAQADISKACKILNWKPLIPLELGLRKLVDWSL